MRTNVYVEASNDYRSVSLGGRRQSNTGDAWINFDWFVDNIREVPDKRYKKEVVMREETYREHSGTNSAYARVYRSSDGSVDVSFRLNDADSFPKGVCRVHLDVGGLSLSFDPYDLRAVKDLMNKGGEFLANLSSIAIVGLLPDMIDLANARTPEEAEEKKQNFIQKRDAVTNLLKECEEDIDKRWDK